MQFAPPDVFAARASRLATLLAERELDALIVTSLPNIAYLTGFFASAGALVVTPNEMVLIGDGRYAQALRARERDGPRIRPIELTPGSSYDHAVVEVLLPLKGIRIGFEATDLTVRRYRFIAGALAERGWTAPLVETDGLIEELRVRKDAWEIETLREGGRKLSRVAKYILSKVLAGRSESDVAAEIDRELRAAGFERPAFDTIVAAGPNAALPHGRAGRRQIQAGDLVVLDFGGVLNGYCTDLSRTVAAGAADRRQRRLIEQVVAAQAAAFRVVRPGVAPEAVDAGARDRLARDGLDDAFTHGTGHGLGLEIHEAPRISRGRPDRIDPPLAAGMVMTLEPGVYFPDWGGVRIEDDVLVTEEGAEWLTDAPRTL